MCARYVLKLLSCIRALRAHGPYPTGAPLSVGFSREREYWSGWPFPFPGGIFPAQGSSLGLLYHLFWQADSLPGVLPGPWPVRNGAFLVRSASLRLAQYRLRAQDLGGSAPMPTLAVAHWTLGCLVVSDPATPWTGQQIGTAVGASKLKSITPHLSI